MKIQTRRLILREWKNKDKQDLIDNLNNINVSKNLFDVPFPFKEKAATKFIQRAKKSASMKKRKEYFLAIELTSSKKVIGAINLERVNFQISEADISYWLGENYWRKGLMSEALEAAKDFLFNKLKLRTINLYAFSENIASKKLAKKFGFKYLRTDKKACKCIADNKIKDNEIYILKQ